jgi:transcriptional regulator with XRE-family HTH domain
MTHTALRRYRLERGLDQAHVAKLVGVSQASISHYESGASYPLQPRVQRATQPFRRAGAGAVCGRA